MHDQVKAISVAIAISFTYVSSLAHDKNTGAEVRRPASVDAPKPPPPLASPPRDSARGTSIGAKVTLPCQAFTHSPARPHDPSAQIFTFDQLEHWYRVPGEFTHRLDGDQYGFETLSFIISETHPGGGPGLHVHDTEEAHVLLAGTAQYQIGEKTFTVQAPYVAKVPAGVPHTFINAGTEPFNLVAVFATRHPNTTRVGPNPLVPVWESQHGALPCGASK